MRPDSNVCVHIAARSIDYYCKHGDLRCSTIPAIIDEPEFLYFSQGRFLGGHVHWKPLIHLVIDAASTEFQWRLERLTSMVRDLLAKHTKEEVGQIMYLLDKHYGWNLMPDYTVRAEWIQF